MTTNRSLGPMQILGLSVAEVNLGFLDVQNRLDSLQGVRGPVDIWDRLRIIDPLQSNEAVTINYLQLHSAPVDASYVVITADSRLTAARVLAIETGVLTLTDAGANSTLTVGIAPNGVGDGKLRQGAATSVMGRSPGSAGNVADIVASANGQVLRRGVGLLTFGPLDLADDVNAVVNVLKGGNGGTGINSYAVGDLLYASAATTLTRLADVATGQVLVSGGVGAAPTYSATPTVTTINVTTGYNKSGVQVVGAQGAAVADATGGTTIDTEARTALNTLLARLRTHGLIAT